MALSPPASKLNGRLRCRRSRDRRRQLQACLPRPCPPASPPGVPVLISRTSIPWLARRGRFTRRFLLRLRTRNRTASCPLAMRSVRRYSRRRRQRRLRNSICTTLGSPCLKARLHRSRTRRQPHRRCSRPASSPPARRCCSILRRRVPELHHLDCLRPPRRRPRPPRRPKLQRRCHRRNRLRRTHRIRCQLTRC